MGPGIIFFFGKERRRVRRHIREKPQIAAVADEGARSLPAVGIGPPVRLGLARHPGEVRHLVRQREGIFTLQKVPVQLRLAKERSHKAQDPDGRVERIQQRVLDPLPMVDRGIAITDNLLRVESPDIVLQRAPVHRDGAARDIVQSIRIAGEEPVELRLVERGPFDAHPGIERRAEIIVSPSQIEPDHQPHRHPGRPT